jgi:hypothetical protein
MLADVCNRCFLHACCMFADKVGYVVTIAPGADGGVDVFVHPRGKPPEDWKVVWLADVPPLCVCR